ncbi:hypothetical protein BCR44DRAFT_308918 [Catenaria anguillulae PL171]|uniref:Uncharacterized protein n=1 Tax=Catenaria anguillulae PL171 TaxID=765915 RepID=A0A1Y2HUG2_9FUNG|nr:hypothetical protein BCR44DRAFT_308918 [Catenaria anguillulae PL171]
MRKRATHVYIGLGDVGQTKTTTPGRLACLPTKNPAGTRMTIIFMSSFAFWFALAGAGRLPRSRLVSRDVKN